MIVVVDHLLQRVALLRERGGHRLDPDRAAAVALGDPSEVTPVERIQAQLVDLEPAESPVVGGLAVATVLIIIVPVFYYLIERLREGWSRGDARSAETRG